MIRQPETQNGAATVCRQMIFNSALLFDKMPIGCRFSKDFNLKKQKPFAIARMVFLLGGLSFRLP